VKLRRGPYALRSVNEVKTRNGLFAMVSNLALGVLLISVNVIVHTAGLKVLAHWMSWTVHGFRLHSHGFGKTVAMVTTVLGLFAVHTVEVWIWGYRSCSRLAGVCCAGSDERIHPYRLVHSLSDCGLHAARTLSYRRALLRIVLRARSVACDLANMDTEVDEIE
jgi:hypothetical protein